VSSAVWAEPTAALPLVDDAALARLVASLGRAGRERLSVHNEAPKAAHVARLAILVRELEARAQALDLAAVVVDDPLGVLGRVGALLGLALLEGAAAEAARDAREAVIGRSRHGAVTQGEEEE
jgi:hypothetical protein